MKKVFIVIFLLWTPFSKADYWTQKTNIFGSGRAGAVGFSIGAKGYIGTGWTFMFHTGQNDFWEWDQLTGSWTQKSNFPGTSRGDAAGFSIGVKCYLLTGIDTINNLKNDFWEWNQTTNIWSQLPNFPGAPRAQASAFSIGLKGYICCGTLGGANPVADDMWEWDQSTGIWTQLANIPMARRACVAFVIDSLAYIGLGSNNGNLNDFWEFNPVQNIWTSKATFAGSARGFAAGFSIEGRGYVGTGAGNSPSYSDFWSYNPTIDLWVQKANYPHSVSDIDQAAFSINCKGYFGTGATTSQVGTATFYNDFWEYTPDSTECSTGINNILNSTFNFLLYPNPVKEILTIEYKIYKTKQIHLSIISDDGKLLISKQVSSLDNKLFISFEHFSDGIYYVVLNDGENKVVKSVLKL